MENQLFNLINDLNNSVPELKIKYNKKETENEENDTKKNTLD